MPPSSPESASILIARAPWIVLGTPGPLQAPIMRGPIGGPRCTTSLTIALSGKSRPIVQRRT
eukprot:2555505-Pyramimonas_sp.AAC.1